MKKSLIYLLVLLGVFLSQSCSQNKTPIENQLARLWEVDLANTSSAKDSNSFLKLSIEKEEGIDCLLYTSPSPRD